MYAVNESKIDTLTALYRIYTEILTVATIVPPTCNIDVNGINPYVYIPIDGRLK